MVTKKGTPVKKTKDVNLTEISPGSMWMLAIER